MSVFKKREKNDSVKPKELKESVENRTEDVGVFTRELMSNVVYGKRYFFECRMLKPLFTLR